MTAPSSLRERLEALHDDLTAEVEELRGDLPPVGPARVAQVYRTAGLSDVRDRLAAALAATQEPAEPVGARLPCCEHCSLDGMPICMWAAQFGPDMHDRPCPHCAVPVESAPSGPSGLTEAERKYFWQAMREWNDAPPFKFAESNESNEILFAAVERILADRARPAQKPGGVLRAGLTSLLADLDRKYNDTGTRGTACGVCSGHSPSWDGHDRNCKRGFIDRVRALLAATGGGEGE